MAWLALLLAVWIQRQTDSYCTQEHGYINRNRTTFEEAAEQTQRRDKIGRHVHRKREGRREGEGGREEAIL